MIKLKQSGIIIIEDAVQMFWFSKQSFIGDFVFNSYRKFIPIDGSLVIGGDGESFTYTTDRYDWMVDTARSIKTSFVNGEDVLETEYLNMFSKAEREYNQRQNILGMNNKSKALLSKVDYSSISKRRRDNYKYVYEALKVHPHIKTLYENNLDNNMCPIGFPILIENRDFVRMKLREFDIYCAIHWDLRNEKWVSDFNDSLWISQRILTLPIDQRYEEKDMDRLVVTLFEILKGENYENI